MKEPSKPKLIQMNFSLIYVNPKNVSLSVTGVTLQPANASNVQMKWSRLHLHIDPIFFHEAPNFLFHDHEKKQKAIRI